MKRARRTLAAHTQMLTGVGLHSGREASVRVCPAPAGAGFVFLDKTRGQEIRALAANVTDTSRCTILGQGSVTVQTVEHLLSALSGLGIDDALVETQGGELPAMDGSAAPFVHLIQSAGVCELPGTITEPVAVDQPVLVEGEDGASLVALPSANLRVTVVLDYPRHEYLGTQAATFDASANHYMTQIAPARTYGFLAEVNWLQARGLALGASHENAVALGEHDYEAPLRFTNELARHKLLDVLGDLALVGRPVQAHILAFKPSHTLNVRLAQKLGELPRALQEMAQS